MVSRLLLTAVVLPLLAGRAEAETYDIHPIYFCPAGDALCGYPDMDAVITHWRRQVGEINLQWEQNGISFRPRDPTIVEGDHFTAMKKTKRGKDPKNDALFDEAIAKFVDTRPDEIVLLLVKGWKNACFNGVPCPSDQNEYDNIVACHIPAYSPLGQSVSLGKIAAHELGHYFCLRHPFTHEDDPEDAPLTSHDNDGLRATQACPELSGVWDTIDDPGLIDLAGEEVDRRPDGTYVEQHTWCHPNYFFDQTDEGSPHTASCVLDCHEVMNGQPAGLWGQAPDRENAMNYYRDSCHGPYVIDGVTYLPFTPGQRDQIHECIDVMPRRAALPDVCKGIGDTDRDGWCDDEDNCKYITDTVAADSNHDHIGDACQLCPDATEPVHDDLDEDGIGDPCDPDMDGDGCFDKEGPNGEPADDQHPGEAWIASGWIFEPNCNPDRVPLYVDEGTDTDGTGGPNCADPDDDDDGIPDEEDGCSLGASPLACMRFDGGCPRIPIWSPLCQLGGCNMLEIAVIAVNPDPTVLGVFDRIAVVNDVLYLGPAANLTLTQSARLLAGQHALMSHHTRPPERLLLEVRDARSHERLGVIADYDPATLRRGDVSSGRFLHVLLPTEREPMSVASAWTVGVEPDAALVDQDLDDVPDLADDCVAAWDPYQRDSDGDGFGDACDADVDQSFGPVDERDLELVWSCQGADLRLLEPTMCGVDDEDDAPIDERALAALALRDACHTTDLDGDGFVGERDLHVVFEALGRPIGPSALRPGIDAWAGGRRR